MCIITKEYIENSDYLNEFILVQIRNFKWYKIIRYHEKHFVFIITEIQILIYSGWQPNSSIMCLIGAELSEILMSMEKCLFLTKTILNILCNFILLKTLIVDDRAHTPRFHIHTHTHTHTDTQTHTDTNHGLY